MKRPSAYLFAAALAAATLAAAAAGCAAPAEAEGPSKKLAIYAWAGEVPDSIVAAFEKETGIEVSVDTFDANETMIAKLSAGSTGYDIVEPTQYAVQQLVGQDLLQPLDHAQIEGLDNLGATFRDPSYDQGNKYSVPWVWGTTGLAYNEECTGGAVDSWGALWDEKYRGKIYQLDNMLGAYIGALQVSGLSATTHDPDEIARGTEALLKQKPLLAGYNSTNVAELLSSGDACVAATWGGTAIAKATAANPQVKYVLPKEGGTMWVDGFAIPKDAPHADAAYEWLNFTLRPEIAALATDDAGSAAANEGAKKHIKDTAALTSMAVYPPAELLKNCEFMVDPGPALKYYQQGWTKVRAS